MSALKKGMEKAAATNDVESFYAQQLEYGQLHGGPSIIEMKGLPGLGSGQDVPGSQGKNPRDYFRGFTNPYPKALPGDSLGTAYDRITEGETDATGFGGSGGFSRNARTRVRDKNAAQNYLRQTYGTTGASSMAFGIKMAQLRKEGWDEADIVKYLSDPENANDLQEQSGLMAMGLMANPWTGPIAGPVLGVGMGIDQLDQTYASFKDRTGKGQSALDAIHGIIGEQARGTLSPVIDLPAKLGMNDDNLIRSIASAMGAGAGSVWEPAKKEQYKGLSDLGKGAAAINSVVPFAGALFGAKAGLRKLGRNKTAFDMISKLGGLADLVGEENRIIHGFGLDAGDVDIMRPIAKQTIGKKGAKKVMSQLARAADANRKLPQSERVSNKALEMVDPWDGGQAYDKQRATDAGSKLSYAAGLTIGDEPVQGIYNDATNEIQVDPTSKNRTTHATHEIIHSIEKKTGFDEGALREMMGEDGFAELQSNVLDSITKSAKKGDTNRSSVTSERQRASAAAYWSSDSEVSRFYLDKYLYDPKSMLKSKNKAERQLAQKMRDAKVDKYAHLLMEDGVIKRLDDVEITQDMFVNARDSESTISMDLIPNTKVNPNAALPVGTDLEKYTDYAADKTAEELRRQGIPVERVIKNEGYYQGASSPGHQFVIKTKKDADGNLLPVSRDMMDRASAIIGKAHDQDAMAWNDFDLPVGDDAPIALHLDNYKGDAKTLQKKAEKAFKNAGLAFDEVVVIPTGEDAIAFPIRYSGDNNVPRQVAESAAKSLKRMIGSKGDRSGVRISGRDGGYIGHKADPDSPDSPYYDSVLGGDAKGSNAVKKFAREGYDPGYKPTIAKSGRLDNRITPDNLPPDPTSTDSGGKSQASRAFDDGEDIELVHYSTKKGLKELDPAFMGTGIFPTAIDKQVASQPGSTKEMNYYPRQTTQEREVYSGAKAAYKTTVKKADLYDMKADPKGIYESYSGKYEFTPGKGATETVGHKNYEQFKKEVVAAGYRGVIANYGDPATSRFANDPYVRLFDKQGVDEISIDEARAMEKAKSDERGSREFGDPNYAREEEPFYSSLIRAVEAKIDNVVRSTPDTVVPGKVIPEQRYPQKDGSVKIVPERVVPEKVTPGVTRKEMVMKVLLSQPGITENEIRYFQLESVLDDLSAKGDFTKEDLANALRANRPDLREYILQDGDDPPDFNDDARRSVDDSFDGDEYLADRFSDEISAIDRTALSIALNGNGSFEQKTFFAGLIRDYLHITSDEMYKQLGTPVYQRRRGRTMPQSFDEIVASVDDVADSGTIDDFRGVFIETMGKRKKSGEAFAKILSEVVNMVNSKDLDEVAQGRGQQRLPEMGEFSDLSPAEVFDMLVTNTDQYFSTYGMLYDDDIASLSGMLRDLDNSYWEPESAINDYLNAKGDPFSHFDESGERDSRVEYEEQYLRENWEPEGGAEGEDGPTQYATHSDSRLERYTELLLKLESPYYGKGGKVKGKYEAPHFDDGDLHEDLIVHARFGYDARDGGLVIDEIQSDLHQAAEDLGYKQYSPALFDASDEVSAATRSAIDDDWNLMRLQLFSEAVDRSRKNYGGVKGYIKSKLGRETLEPGEFIYDWIRADVARDVFRGNSDVLALYDDHSVSQRASGRNVMYSFTGVAENAKALVDQAGGSSYLPKFLELIPEIKELAGYKGGFEDIDKATRDLGTGPQSEPARVMSDIAKEGEVTQAHVDRINAATKELAAEINPDYANRMDKFRDTVFRAADMAEEIVLRSNEYGLSSDENGLWTYKNTARQLRGWAEKLQNLDVKSFELFNKKETVLSSDPVSLESLTERASSISETYAQANPMLSSELLTFRELADAAESGKLGEKLREGGTDYISALEKIRDAFDDPRIDSIIKQIEATEPVMKMIEGVQPGPFDSTQQWTGVMLRRLLREAARDGKGQESNIYITPGWEQIGRYFGTSRGDMAFEKTTINPDPRTVDAQVKFTAKADSGFAELESTHGVIQIKSSRRFKYELVDKESGKSIGSFDKPKAAAERIIRTLTGTSGSDLENLHKPALKSLTKAIMKGEDWDGKSDITGYVGAGDGHLEFYNSILPKSLQKYLKTLDPETPEPVLTTDRKGKHKLVLTQKAAQAILGEGQPLFRGSKDFGGDSGTPPPKQGMLERFINKLTGKTPGVKAKAYKKSNPKTPLDPTSDPAEPTVVPPKERKAPWAAPKMKREDKPRQVPPDKVDEADLGERHRMRDTIKETEDMPFEYEGKSYRSHAEAKEIAESLRDRNDMTKRIASRKMDEGYGMTDFELFATRAELADARALRERAMRDHAEAEASGDVQAAKMAEETLRKADARIATLAIGAVESNSNNGRNLAAARSFVRGMATASVESALRWVNMTNRGAKVPTKTRQKIVKAALVVEDAMKAVQAEDAAKVKIATDTLSGLAGKMKGKKITLDDLKGCS